MQSLAHSAPETVAVHSRFLYRYALSRLRRPETAEELVQETMLAALEGKATFRGESALRTWLAGILKHKIADWQRREGRSPIRANLFSSAEADSESEFSIDAQFDADGAWVTPPTTWPSPDKAFENQRFWETFERCLAVLPAATARAFYLREIQGLSTEEICAELNISSSNCWVMLHRARMSLRKSLEERWFLKDEKRPTSSRPAQACAAME